MVYEVLARKWRPKQFDQVVGQTHVTTTLRNALRSGRLGHAYLFTGPRGVGKTSIARILAKALNCAEGPTETPCDRCDACREIAAGASLDVLEIDGASNNSVDQVRELRESARFAPMRGRYKVYIIDEVHMLSTGAFNALLKTLEEPPPHVKFFFATTEPEKVPATIISRCQRFDLRRIPLPLIVDRLRLVAREEGVTVDEDALLAVARGAEGGLRDAESALDQIIAFGGRNVQESDVLSVFGLVPRATLESMAEQILRGDVPGLLRSVAEVDEAGKDLRRFAVELMEHFRNLIVCLNVETPETILTVTDSQLQILRQQAALTDTERALRITRILADAEERLHYALSRRVLLETALIRAARAAVTVSVEEILRRLEACRDRVQPGVPSAQPSAGKVCETTFQTPAVAGACTGAPSPPDPPPSEPTTELARLQSQWSQVIEIAGRILLGARAVLAETRPVSVDHNRVILKLDPDTPRAVVDLPARTRRAVERALRTFLGRNVHVEWRFRDQEVSEEPPAPDPEPAAGVRDRTKAEGIRASPQRAMPANEPADLAFRIKTWSQNPQVQEALKLFGGRVVDVRD